MAGLLGDVLPYVYSRGNALRRGLLDFAQNPLESLQQTAGLLVDRGREQQNVLARAFSDPSDPFRVTDGGALNQATMNVLAGPLGFAPVGMIDTKALAAKYPDIAFNLMQRGDGGVATLGKVVVPPAQRGQGVGSAFMDDLTRAADADGATLALSPSSDFGGNKSRLIEFYRRFGFVPNKGRNIDYEISESMYRAPKK
jgi:GNAT superfamily N-acetyltransferase